MESIYRNNKIFMRYAIFIVSRCTLHATDSAVTFVTETSKESLDSVAAVYDAPNMMREIFFEF